MLVALPGSGAAQPRRRAATPFLPAPVVRSATDASGRSVAWSVSGSGGPPTVEVSGLPTHLLLDWRDPLLGDFQRELGAERRLLRHDRPGTGLCGGAAAAPHLDATALDAVVAASGEGRVALLAHSFGAAAAVELCLRRPQAVSHLVLFGAAARLHDDPGSGALTPQLADALARLARADWQLASRTLADLLLPGADSATLNAYSEHLRTVAGGEAAAEMLRAVRDVDLREMLPHIAVPTLVLHRRDDRVVALHAARDLASRIAGARLEVLDGAEHLPHAGDTASVSAAIARFLSPAVHPLTRREIDVLRQIGEGLTNQEAGAELGVSEATVARHLANVYAKLDVATRGAAVARARRWGLL
ncbi:MAG TPA: alpha/beta fold hydrolase [Candidatus Dormibacteraeota bacterium]|nr:alpha/beta fold hydrolase [Candidatus Dormibacteraeota bacterium]